MWEEIESRLEQIEKNQREFHGKCDDVRGEFVTWLLNEFFKARDYTKNTV